MSGRSSGGISFPAGSTSSIAPCPPSTCPSQSKSERRRRPSRPAPIQRVNMACNTLWYIFAEMLETPQEDHQQRTEGHLTALQHAPGMLAAQQATGNLIAALIEK